MAADPAFAATPKVGAALVPGTADTSRTAPANASTVVTAGASGMKIEELVLQGVGTTVAGIIGIFIHDGTTYHLFDEVPVTAVTPSTTVPAFRASKTYLNLILQNGWTLRVTTQVGNLSLIKVIAIGGDL